jgi:predicted RND superfamily exporter protein
VVSCMALAHVPIMMPTQILPSFLLAVGVGDSVHILAIFYHRLDKGDDKESAIIYAMQHSGLAVLMTSLTTAAGLASFSTAEVAPIAHLGIFASFGVLLAFVYTVTILPSLISLLPISSKAPETSDEKHGEASLLDRLLDKIADISVSYPKIIISISLITIVGSLSLATTIRFSHDPLSWLPSDSPVRKSTYLIDEQLRGSGTMEVIVDAGQENGLVNPTLLHALDEVNQMAAEIDDEFVFVGKVLSITDILKEIHQALHANDPSFHLIADDRELLAQELLLFENSGSDDLEDFVDSQLQMARVTIKVPWLDAVEYTRFTDHIKNLYRDRLGELAQIHTTGMLPLLTRTVDAAMRSAVRSYIIAGFVISLMMILLVGDLRLGLICMLPNLTPIFLMLGIMGIFDMPLDMFTMLIGSIAIGLAVDDTIHFMRNYTRYFDETGDSREAVRHTLQTTGRAMFITTVVLALGFFIYMFSSMHNLFNFGLLTGVAIVTALLADYFLAPALVTLLARSRDNR